MSNSARSFQEIEGNGLDSWMKGQWGLESNAAGSGSYVIMPAVLQPQIGGPFKLGSCAKGGTHGH